MNAHNIELSAGLVEYALTMRDGTYTLTGHKRSDFDTLTGDVTFSRAYSRVTGGSAKRLGFARAERALSYDHRQNCGAV